MRSPTIALTRSGGAWSVERYRFISQTNWGASSPCCGSCSRASNQTAGSFKSSGGRDSLKPLWRRPGCINFHPGEDSHAGLVAVMDEVLRLALGQRDVERREHAVRRQALSYGPTYHTPAPHIDDHCKVQEPCKGGHVGHTGHPKPIGATGPQLTFGHHCVGDAALGGLALRQA